jgi:hypothetical protein
MTSPNEITGAGGVIRMETVGFTGGGLLRVYSCSDVVANRL